MFNNLRCPECGMFIGYSKMIWKPEVRLQCGQCGCKLKFIRERLAMVRFCRAALIVFFVFSAFFKLRGGYPSFGYDYSGIPCIAGIILASMLLKVVKDDV